ncbi:MAG TPA: hypothetical protein VGH67_17830 [Solirubrobacteraceae bacterium]|jgi:hypothetical protein
MARRSGRPRGLRGRARLAGAALAVALAGVLAASAQAASAGPSTRVSVKPGSGGPRAHFAFSFRVPVALGSFGSLIRRDALSVSGPRSTRCVSRASSTLRKARKGARARLTLTPGAAGRGGWCPGLWHGTVVQTEVLRCTPGPARVCPDLVVAPRTLARFRFRVKPAPQPAPPVPPGADVPTFAGLISATSCPSPSPQPQVLPRPNSYTLTWKAATDPVTPSSQLVYDIFVATTSGAENYAQPSFTTAPGATSYVTQSAARIGPLFFVVRARNDAGHEDQNTVERQGITQCPAG